MIKNEINRADVLKAFGWSKSEYNDLTRPRISKIKKLRQPFFSPINQARRGRGHKHKLSFNDLMLLNILMGFHRGKIMINRYAGHKIRELIISSKKHNIWDESFNNKSDWNIELNINNDNDKIFVRLIKNGSTMSTVGTTSESGLAVFINLNIIHKTTQETLKKNGR